MSVILGIRVRPNSIVDKVSLFRVADATRRYGIDDTKVRAQGRIGMGFQAFHTHARSRLEQQPVLDSFGNMLTWDGRLDNHRELASKLDLNYEDIPDSALVLRAFARWGKDCFARLVGDWAIALWSPNDRVLYLARDHAGTRTLFYRNENGEIMWSTYLESFFVDGSAPQLNDEYVARVLSSQDIRNLTPYKGIRAVPPAHYMAIRDGEGALRPHWQWVANTSITYKSDAEYDEHFLALFRQAVLRRIGPGDPVLAQLSGGMDSTSIVCMADEILRESSSEANPVDTISYYDDTEPDWNERPYFEAVESFRHKKGIHLDCHSQAPSYKPLILLDRFYPYPGGDQIFLDVANQFEESVAMRGYRVILSGVGGDELLGGVPAPMPELANYLVNARFLKLLSRAAEWCMATRQPLVRMLYDTLIFTRDLYWNSRANRDTSPPWLSSEMRKLCFESGSLQSELDDPVTGSPSAISNGRVWWSVLEGLPHLSPHLLGCYEYRYPYLDRDLVGFLHRIPREQLVRPGRRRALMRRALKEIVPVEIVERKRKAHMSRGGIARLSTASQTIQELFANPLSAEYGFIDRNKFLLALGSEFAGDHRWLSSLISTINIELWLHCLRASGVGISFTAHPSGHKNLLPITVSGKPKLRGGPAES